MDLISVYALLILAFVGFPLLWVVFLWVMSRWDQSPQLASPVSLEEVIEACEERVDRDYVRAMKAKAEAQARLDAHRKASEACQSFVSLVGSGIAADRPAAWHVSLW